MPGRPLSHAGSIWPRDRDEGITWEPDYRAIGPYLEATIARHSLAPTTSLMKTAANGPPLPPVFPPSFPYVRLYARLLRVHGKDRLALSELLLDLADWLDQAVRHGRPIRRNALALLATCLRNRYFVLPGLIGEASIYNA